MEQLTSTKRFVFFLLYALIVAIVDREFCDICALGFLGKLSVEQTADELWNDLYGPQT
jgi:hypothetical protein